MASQAKTRARRLLHLNWSESWTLDEYGDPQPTGEARALGSHALGDLPLAICRGTLDMEDGKLCVTDALHDLVPMVELWRGN